MGNVETVSAIYEAFGRGDIEFILDQLSDDVEWEPDAVDHGVPWLVPGRGKEHVAGFFSAVNDGLEIARFEPTNILEGADQVAAVIAIEANANPTGSTIADVEVHLWTFAANGKVVAMRHLLDTHQHIVGAGIGVS